MTPKDISYLQFMSSVVEINKRYSLTDYKEILVLRVILSNFAVGTSIFVNDVMLMSDIGSQVTIHGVIKRLIIKRMIKSVIYQEDNRRKYLVPMDLSLLNCCQFRSTI
jgi:DNA-binding MarR family transcriptional regulator